MSQRLELLSGGAQYGEWARFWDNDRWPQSELPNGDLSTTHRGDRAVNFARIDQPWLKEAAKCFAKSRLLTGSSVGTLVSYACDLKPFSQWLTSTHPNVVAPAMLTRAILEDYMLFVRSDDLKPATKTRRIGSLRLLIEEQRHDALAGIPVDAIIHSREVPAVPYSLPPRQITESMYGQFIDPENLALLPVNHQTLVLTLALTGMRVSSIVTLRRDCVSVGPDGHPYLRYWNIKMGRETMLPIPERLADQIERQESWIRESRIESEYLFPRRNDSRTPHVCHSTVRRVLKRYVKVARIVDEHGEEANFAHPHLFRHHVGTSMVNDGVPLNVVAKVLDHNSLEMTARYAHLHDATLRREVERWYTRVNARGETIALPLDGSLAEASWMKERLARAKQALPNGYCGLPLVQTCPHPNACLACDSFLTDGSFLPGHKEHLVRTNELLDSARESGQVRLVEMLESDGEALTRIIDALEDLKQNESLDLRDGLAVQ